MSTTQGRKASQRILDQRGFFRNSSSPRDDSWDYNDINSVTLNKLPIKIGEAKIKALLDSGSIGNYISPEAVRRVELTTTLRKTPCQVRVASGGAMPGQSVITHETVAQVHINRYQIEVTLDILSLASKDVILGLLWLQEVNLRIN
jgi:hypothetical protein